MKNPDQAHFYHHTPMCKQNFLFIIGHFHPDIGGTEKACCKMAVQLQKLGIGISILTAYREGLPPFEVIEGIPVYRYIKGWHLFEVTYMLSVLSFLIAHRRTIDGIFCFGLYLFTAPAVLFCRCTGRLIYFRLGSARQTGDFYRIAQLKSNRFILWCAKKAHGAIAISSEIEAELIQHGFARDKIFRISNGIDTDIFSPGGQRDDTIITICYVGRLTEGKGLETLINAAAEIKKSAVAFEILIVGDGELLPVLLREISGTGLEKYVTFAGRLDNVVPSYRQSHIFVLPSHSEGMPLSLLEAMACGLAVVASKVGGIPEAVDPDGTGLASPEGFIMCDNGILVHPGSPTELATALKKLIEDGALRSRIARNARSHIIKSYDLHDAALQYQKLIAGS
jgi:glycosyltransferase involved in cell wall biosynthesis